MIRIALLLAAALAAWAYYPHFVPKHWPPGILVAREPYQGPNLANGPVHQQGAYRIQELAAYVLDARVLGKEHYSDAIGPYDLALGWQHMSDSSVLDRLDITQFARFYHYEWQGTAPADPTAIARTSANTHILPANDEVLKTLKKVREGDLVHIEGHLVHVNGPDGWQWQSSMTRDDTGAGACEVVWVDKLVILEQPPV